MSESTTDGQPIPVRKRPVGPVDPLTGPKQALAGRLVLMDEAFRVIPRGTVYIDQGAIIEITLSGAPIPNGFQDVPVVNVRGTMFPGLIELHNHLAYNALRLWDVPKSYTNRNQWSGIPAYRRLISGPMQILGKSPELVPALIRYVECKSLVGGVTTSQGLQLFSNAGIRRYYRGIGRNVEHTGDPGLPEAAARIADIEAKDAAQFMKRLLKATCLLLHLSEGVDEFARKHFQALEISPGEWAIGRQLAGIHCAGLTEDDFRIYGRHQGAMIWSPLSNLLLYGETAKIKAAKEAAVIMGIGSDWSPSGSKNLLGELKVARIVSQEMGSVFSDRDIVSMATRNAAAILQWDALLGSLEVGKRADLLVISGVTGDPYEQLLEAKETDICLVMINGIARYGLPRLMHQLTASGEILRIGGRERMVFLEQATADPSVGELTLHISTATLREALTRLPELAREFEQPTRAPRRAFAEVVRRMPVRQDWTLALDELEDVGVELRPRLPLPGEEEPTGAVRALDRAARPLSEIVEPLELDPLTVADDATFLDRLNRQVNLPGYVKAGLQKMY
jgi:cytosine/adenosine deaminase-related metal-dependent hydrolase